MMLSMVASFGADQRPRSAASSRRSAIDRAAQAYNTGTLNPQGKAIRPRIEPSLAATGREADDSATALQLSDRIRRGELDAYVVIPANAIPAKAAVIILRITIP